MLSQTDDIDIATAESVRSNNRHWVDVLHNSIFAWLILAFSLIITLVAWKISNEYAENRAEERFNFQVVEATHSIEKRFLNYEQVLHGGLGLFTAFGDVTRQQWHDYFETLQIDTYYPGTLGIGYAQWIKPQELAQHIAEVRAEGFDDFVVKPTGEREIYSSIKYLEPFNFRNRRAFGYDMYSEPTRREAMSRARDSGSTALSGKVTLVQETSTDVQAGFLIYVPVYTQKANSVEERQRSLKGFVYSALRVGDLMKGILGEGNPELDFEIFDGDKIIKDSLLYASDNTTHLEHSRSAARFSTSALMRIGGHQWTIYYTSNKNFDAVTTTSQPMVVAVGGVIIDLLLFNVIFSLSRLRKRAQVLADERMKKLYENELRFKAITDSAYDGIVSMDAEKKITYFNKAAQRIFGYHANEIIGKPLQLLFPSSQYERLNGLQLYTVDDGRANFANEPIEMTARDQKGKEFTMEFSMAGWKLGDNVNFTAIMRDISERHRVEKIKNEFISTVSHELRTPLTAIWGSLKIVKSGKVCALNEPALELLDNAQRNCDRLTRLINDILDIEKIESGKMDFALSDYSLLKLVRESIQSNQVIAARNNVAIKLSESADPTVSVDPDRFMQVMTNLIANAIKFSPSDSAIEINISLYGDYARVAVTDRGPGIPEEFRDRIFGKFAQADSTDSKKYGGTGLGLSIAKEIITSFRGEIHYQSDPGVHTTFYFLLPVSEQSKFPDSKVNVA